MQPGDIHIQPPGGVRVVVIGGSNTDFIGTPDILAEKDSAPGHVTVSSGGVARNIAENLARLEVETHLLSAFGADATSRELLALTREAGVRVENAITVDDMPGARYVAVNDADGDLVAAVNDMRVIERLDIAALSHPARLRLLQTASMIVVDANLSAEVLAWLASEFSAPMVVDPVSAAKAPRVTSILGWVSAIKPNAHEAAVLLGIDAPLDLEAAEKAARALVDRGARRAFVTPGSPGITWADRSGSGRIESPGFEPVNTAGAGDAFLAGVVYAMLSDADTQTQARFGSAVSSIALRSESTVSHDISRQIANATFEELYG